MRFLLKPKNKLFLNLFIGFILFCFSLQALAAPISAITAANPTSQQAQTQPLSPTNQAQTPVQPQKPVSGELAQWQLIPGIPGGIIPLPDFLDPRNLLPDLPGVGDILNAITSLLATWMQKIFVTGLSWALAAFGFVFDFGLNGCGRVFDAFSGLLGDAGNNGEIARKVNLFTLMDSGFTSAYTSLPKNATVNGIASTFQDNILGIKTASAEIGVDYFGNTIKGFWGVSQRFAIVLMVIALMVIGFMVMLRRRLDPRTVVTATNSLPRFGLALVLIVFSFAISGFFIDLINVMVALVRESFSAGTYYLTDVGWFGGELVMFPFWVIGSGATLVNWPAFICNPIIIGMTALSGGAGTFVLLLIIMIIELISRIALWLLAAYLFWILVKSYAYMIIYTVFSPIFFMVGAIPGFEGVTKGWFKRMAVNALVFPGVLLFVMIGVAMLISSNPFEQVFGGSNVSAPDPIASTIVSIPYLIGFGVLFFATKLPKFLEKTFKLEDFDIKGGMGPSVLLAPVALPMGAAKAAGNVGKSISGIRDLSNNAGHYGGVASRAFFGGGYQPGEAQVNRVKGTDGFQSATIPVTPKPGFGAAVARTGHSMIPGVFKAPDVKGASAGTTTVSPETRRAIIVNEKREAEKSFRAPNYAKYNIGEVNQNDVDWAHGTGEWRSVQPVDIKSAPPIDIKSAPELDVNITKDSRGTKKKPPGHPTIT